MDNNLGLSHFWQQADSVSHSVAYLLLILSIVSWYYILGKAWLSWRVRRQSQQTLSHFWAASSMPDALRQIQTSDADGLFSDLAQASAQAAQLSQSSAPSLNTQIDPSELITRSLRQAINRNAARLESGQTLLASVGSTAPFIGLFGTVWGIYHALLSIAGSGQIMIDKVAGPVGEALIMTAAGLAVAIPAVLAYNAFTRVNRLILADLDGFAHDLHAYYTTGQQLSRPLRPAHEGADSPAKIGA
ncbi:MotA/TolQ/ExbB proton channel family protein [Parvibium lacunae]|uniref:Biopolymer transport protein ExbB n=1 Tax=Parvibium lacunae TaxID=1888893 RepID=A0A368L455_9BURK|nr:MotA/TolQ/ExbB proton channel family protein [Parvibium lacunae]RCS58354.1 MotA/TolQ/ExbB proton channel family protein [Parvibium lacunae]